MPAFFTEEEVNFIEGLNTEIEKWNEMHNDDVDTYRYSDDKEENERNARIRQLSNELYDYYYNLRYGLEDILTDIHMDLKEYDKLTSQTDKEGIE